MNAEKQDLALLEEPAFDLYRRLVDFAASLSKAVVLLVVRPEIDLSNSGRQVLSTLEPYLVERRRSPSWPGTQLFDADTEVSYFRLLPESAKVLKAVTDRLYGWCHPDLPEDLCFLSEDGEPWLVTIADYRQPKPHHELRKLVESIYDRWRPDGLPRDTARRVLEAYLEGRMPLVAAASALARLRDDSNQEWILTTSSTSARNWRPSLIRLGITCGTRNP